MTSKEMQKLSAQARWGKMTPEQRSMVMSRVRAARKPHLGRSERRIYK